VIKTGLVHHPVRKLAAAAFGLMLLAGCNEDGRFSSNSRHFIALSPEIQALMSEKGMSARAPVLFRAFKKESEFEVWKADASGEYKLLKTYPMCRWSGQLGPKKTEGDRQVPEGFYSITPAQLNPNSSYFLSFNVGYPNAYDRAYGRYGSHIMVHGACSSRGCFSMTDAQIAEIYALTREAFGGGQKAVQMQSLPFRFTPQNLARYRVDENLPFWKNLKEGSDHFEVSKREPQVSVCAKRYVFNASPKDGAGLDAASACPPLAQDAGLVAAVSEKARKDEQQVAELVAQGATAVKRIYQDGDQHPSFKATSYASVGPDQVARAAIVPTSVSRVPDVSQPDALALGPVDIPVEEARGLSKAQLLAKANALKAQEAAASAQAPVSVLAPASVPALAILAPATPTSMPLSARPAKAGGLPAPGSASASALVAQEPARQELAKKDSPAFYQNWLGTLGGLTASASDTGDGPAQPVSAPVPPKAPKR